MGRRKWSSTKVLIVKRKKVVAGGESGIRTHDTVSRIHAFQACAFDHSAISPQADGPICKARTRFRVEGFYMGAAQAQAGPEMAELTA